MPKITDILKTAVELNASDIHFSAGDKIWIRADGSLHPLDPAIHSHETLRGMLFDLLSDSEREVLETRKNLDKSYAIAGLGSFRLNLFYTRRGIGAVVRTLSSKMPTLEQLRLPPVVKTLAELPKGLILVTGPTGSGKSTTLAAMINHINENFHDHILTVEDPVEFIHESKKSLVNQREIGQSCPTFADALKYALREDPDVILVGEMRDLETIQLALTAAETGHLVFGTLHTRGAAPTIDRIIESFPAIQQPMVRAMLADSLRAVISQVLLPRKSGKGRVAAYEILVMNFGIANLVREGKTFQIPSLMQTGRKEGMILMETCLKELVLSGEIHEADAGGTSAPRSEPERASLAVPPPIMTSAPKIPPAMPDLVEVEELLSSPVSQPSAYPDPSLRHLALGSEEQDEALALTTGTDVSEITEFAETDLVSKPVPTAAPAANVVTPSPPTVPPAPGVPRPVPAMQKILDAKKSGPPPLRPLPTRPVKKTG